jgi:hypothetical protein
MHGPPCLPPQLDPGLEEGDGLGGGSGGGSVDTDPVSSPSHFPMNPHSRFREVPAQQHVLESEAWEDASKTNL